MCTSWMPMHGLGGINARLRLLRSRCAYQVLEVLRAQVVVIVEVIHPEGREDLHRRLCLWREHVEEVEELIEVQISRTIGREDPAEPRR